MLGRIKKAQYKFWNPFFRQVSEDAKGESHSRPPSLPPSLDPLYDDSFSPAAVWSDFIRHLLVVDPAKRLTARAALEHKWFRLSRRSLSVHCLVDTQEKLKDMRTARTKLKAAVDTVRPQDFEGGVHRQDAEVEFRRLGWLCVR